MRENYSGKLHGLSRYADTNRCLRVSHKDIRVVRLHLSALGDRLMYVLDYNNVFMIQAIPRTGSHMLGLGLAQHDDIKYYDELFNRYDPSWQGEERGNTLSLLIEKYLGARKPCWGFAIHETLPYLYNQAKEIWSQTYHKMRVIKLRRRQELEAVVSYIKAAKTGQWTVLQPNTQIRNSVEPITAKEIMIVYNMFKQTEEIAEQLRFPRTITVFYEDLVNDWERQTRRVLTFLGLDYQAIQPTTIKTGKSLRETLPNYEQLKVCLQDTPLGQYFGE